MKHYKQLLLLLLLAALTLSTPTLAQNKVTAFALPDGSILDRRIKMDLKTDQDGNTWIAFGGRYLGGNLIISSIGLAVFNGNTWTTYNKDNSSLPTNFLTSIEFESSTITWIGTKNGLVKKEGSTWTIFNTTNSGIISDSVNDVSVKNGIVWIATDKGVSQFNGTTWTNYTKSGSAIADDIVKCVQADNNGKVWIGTSKGLSQFDNGIWTTFTKANTDLKNDRINTLHLDKQGNIWVGTDSAVTETDEYAGLYKLDNGEFKSVQQVSGKCENKGQPLNVYSIASSTLGKVYTNGVNYNYVPFNSMFNLFEVSSSSIRIFGFRDNMASPLGGVLLDVLSNGNVVWAGRDGFIGDSLYLVDMNKAAPLTADKGMGFLDINKVSTPVLTRGDMGWDLMNAQYEVPKGSCKKAMGASSLWIGGVSNGNLHLAAQTYRQNGSDYVPGPLTVGTTYTDKITQDAYNKVWRVNRQAIEEFKQNFANGNVGNGTYPIPASILTWPAHGDINSGQAKYLAPFVDVDSDGEYNPMAGDYPKIKGDQMLYWIFNDNGGIHGETDGAPLKFEIHGSAYAFVCNTIGDNDNDAVLNYTTLYHYDIINRSNEAIDSVKYGLWHDVDLGNYADDYIGSNPAGNYGYVVNSTPDDEGRAGYGQNPPALAVVLLKGPTKANGETEPLNGFMYYSNDFSSMGNPSRAEHYWNYMNNKWKDDLPLTYGGNGRGGSDTASFMFPGTHDLAGRPDWSEYTAQNGAGDRRFLMHMNGGTMLPGAVNEIDYAIVYSRVNTSANWPNPLLTKLDADLQKVKGWYANNNFPSCLDLTIGINEVDQQTAKGQLSVFPNPANTAISIQGIKSSVSYEIYDIAGKLVLQGSTLFSDMINIQSLTTGLYIIKTTDGTTTQSGKFIKE